MTSSAEQIASKLAQAGFIVLLPGELPPRRVIEIADALLASPAAAVQIVPNGPNTLDTLSAIRKRAGDHMLVGAARIETGPELGAAISAGAQFASSAAEFNLPLLADAKKRSFLYIPTIHAPGQMLVAHRAHCPFLQLRDDIDVEGLEGLQERAEMIKANPTFIINQVELELQDACYEAGANLVTINDIYQHDTQSMADIITRTRQARTTWLEYSAT